MRPKDLPEPEPVSPFRHLDERKAAIYENLRDCSSNIGSASSPTKITRQTKKDLQKELAVVLAEMDRIKAATEPERQPCRRPRPKRRRPANLPALRRQIPAPAQILRRMRQADEGGESVIRTICCLRCVYAVVLCCCALSAFAAVDGAVINRTTGKPQAGATVTLTSWDRPAWSPSKASSPMRRASSLDQPARDGPHLIQAAYDGVTYNHMLPPGSPTTGLSLDVYKSSKHPGAAHVLRNFMILSSLPARSWRSTKASFPEQWPR